MDTPSSTRRCLPRLVVSLHLLWAGPYARYQAFTRVRSSNNTEALFIDFLRSFEEEVHNPITFSEPNKRGLMKGQNLFLYEFFKLSVAPPNPTGRQVRHASLKVLLNGSITIVSNF
ncbi:predicted protein [Sclerotinia sclerotiorum 1980 UF-70]|uniref:Uncharacterized protein n=1 Tax=Sclerotinia sclerotiorum (strain ATCC 18683 / 1980 / Ss-1) TaxID=665079 RepID=A7E655_SCLS1|nr:predicted protein [Sclerotinia sclerotiorum 1980 UF-70]EDN91377.1 predicted protein [Sclerotinia sclerotiorum 1980 UF-70]